MNREPSSRPTGTRRRVAVPAERSISSTTLLAMLVPVLTIAALATVHPTATEDPSRPPQTGTLTRSTVVCPPALPGTEEAAVMVAAGRADEPAGSGTVRLRGTEDALEVSSGQVVERREPGHLVMLGEDETAAGLVAARFGAGVSVECTRPASGTWFTGVGAGAEHQSVLQLINPDGGPAVADVSVFGEDGAVDVPGLRGLTVRGNKAVKIDLAEVIPRRDELAMHVSVTRGRLASSVVDRYDELGSEVRSVDWLAGQPDLASTSYLLGLGGADTGSRALVVANPGADEARVSIKVVTERSEFSPAGIDELVVPPGSTAAVDLSRALSGKAGRGSVGVRLDSDQEVSASLRSVLGEDQSFAVAAPPVTSRAVAVVGPGPKRLVLAGATRVTKVNVVLRDADGQQIGEEEVSLQPGLGTRTSLDAHARSVEVRVDGGALYAVLESGPPGLAVRPLQELVVDRKIPDVRPALY